MHRQYVGPPYALSVWLNDSEAFQTHLSSKPANKATYFFDGCSPLALTVALASTLVHIFTYFTPFLYQSRFGENCV